MKLYLVQHGEAVSEEVDVQRPLSSKGRLDVRKVGEFLRRARLKVQLIWHSGKMRARQTAEILGEALSVEDNVIMKEGLAPLDPIEEVEKELRAREEDLMIVGHLPFLGKLVSRLLISSDSPNLVTFQQGAIVCLERLETQSWSLKWMVTPELL